MFEQRCVLVNGRTGNEVGWGKACWDGVQGIKWGMERRVVMGCIEIKWGGARRMMIGCREMKCGGARRVVMGCRGDKVELGKSCKEGVQEE